MRARALINGASVGPETLKVLGTAFDAAWAEIERSYPSPTDREAARLKLASIILGIANEESRDAEALKRAALKGMALR